MVGVKVQKIPRYIRTILVLATAATVVVNGRYSGPAVAADSKGSALQLQVSPGTAGFKGQDMAGAEEAEMASLKEQRANGFGSQQASGHMSRRSNLRVLETFPQNNALKVRPDVEFKFIIEAHGEPNNDRDKHDGKSPHLNGDARKSQIRFESDKQTKPRYTVTLVDDSKYVTLPCTVYGNQITAKPPSLLDSYFTYAVVLTDGEFTPFSITGNPKLASWDHLFSEELKKDAEEPYKFSTDAQPMPQRDLTEHGPVERKFNEDVQVMPHISHRFVAEEVYGSEENARNLSGRLVTNGIIRRVAKDKLEIFGFEPAAVDSHTVTVPKDAHLKPGMRVDVVVVNGTARLVKVNLLNEHAVVFTTGSELHQPTQASFSLSDDQPAVIDDCWYEVSVTDDYMLPAHGASVSPLVKEFGRVANTVAADSGVIEKTDNGRKRFSLRNTEAELVELSLVIRDELRSSNVASFTRQIKFKPGPPFNLSLAVPNAVQAGRKLSVSGEVTDKYGNPVQDNTEVSIALGESRGIAATNNGQFSLELDAPTMKGAAELAVSCGDVALSREITVMPGDPSIIQANLVQVGQPSDNTVVISGQVFDEFGNGTEGMPISVQLRSSTGGTEETSILTDSDGAFSFSVQLPPSEYTIMALQAGDAQWQSDPMLASSPSGTSNSVILIKTGLEGFPVIINGDIMQAEPGFAPAGSLVQVKNSGQLIGSGFTSDDGSVTVQLNPPALPGNLLEIHILSSPSVISHSWQGAVGYHAPYTELFFSTRRDRVVKLAVNSSSPDKLLYIALQKANEDEAADGEQRYVPGKNAYTSQSKFLPGGIWATSQYQAHAEYRIFLKAGLYKLIPMTTTIAGPAYNITVQMEDTLEAAPPELPEGLTASYEDLAIRVSWQLTDYSDLSYVNVWRSRDPSMSDKEIIAGVLGEVTQFVDKNVSPGQTYYYAVEHVNGRGISSGLSQQVSAVFPSTYIIEDTHFTMGWYYGHTWAKLAGAEFSGGTAFKSNSYYSPVLTIRAEGSRFSLITRTGPAYGVINFAVDNYTGQLNLYAPEDRFALVDFGRSFEEGTHTIKLWPASWSPVIVDAIMASL